MNTKEYNATYWETNKEWINAKRRALTAMTPQERRAREYHMKYYIRKPKYKMTEQERINHRAAVHRQTARKKSQLGPNPPTAKYLKELLSKKCAYCDKPSEQIDHIIPISKGGLHDISNVIGACKKCNQKKAAKII